MIETTHLFDQFGKYMGFVSHHKERIDGVWKDIKIEFNIYDNRKNKESTYHYVRV